MSEEEKPVTDLTIYAPLELINLNKLPSKSLDELRVLTNQRASALASVRATLWATSLASIVTVMIILGLLTGGVAGILSFFGFIICAILAVCSGVALRWHIEDVRNYRKIEAKITPQLLLEVGEEEVVFWAARANNERAIGVNARLEVFNEFVPEEGVKHLDLNLQKLKKEKEEIAARSAMIDHVASKLQQKKDKKP